MPGGKQQLAESAKGQRKSTLVHQPTLEEAQEAVRTLIAYAGDAPNREGVRDTPARVTQSYGEHFAGYRENPVEILERTFEDLDGYDEMVLLRDINFVSHCEHHILPIIGKAHIAYLPKKRVVGISKLARVVEIYARRLQFQEKLTSQIANTINDVLNPLGVAVLIEASHQCMTTRGINKYGVNMITRKLLGAFHKNPQTRQHFLALLEID